MARDLTSLTTDELLRLASGGASPEDLGQAVAMLVTRYRGIVYNHALHVARGNRALADDIFQDAFLRLFTWLRDRKGSQPLHSFPRLVSVFAKRAAIDLMRKEIRATPTGSEAETLFLPSGEEDLESRAYIYELLEHLDERSRKILIFTYFEGLTALEIAQKMRLEPGHVRILRFRALEALRARRDMDAAADIGEAL
jgi:RNA polymerase sigma factor (sigma-70 family)